MSWKGCCLIALLGVFLTSSWVWASPAVVGSVRKAEGQVWLLRSDEKLSVEQGTELLLGDTVVTGAQGSVGLILKDNSRLSLGSKSQMQIQEYLFAPAEGQLGMLAELARGTLSCVSGSMTKLAPGSMKIKTPTSTIGVRGTTFLLRAEGS